MLAGIIAWNDVLGPFACPTGHDRDFLQETEKHYCPWRQFRAPPSLGRHFSALFGDCQMHRCWKLTFASRKWRYSRPREPSGRFCSLSRSRVDREIRGRSLQGRRQELGVGRVPAKAGERSSYSNGGRGGGAESSNGAKS